LLAPKRVKFALTQYQGNSCFTSMKIKTSHLILGAIAIIGLSQGENVRSSLVHSDQVRKEQAGFSEHLRQKRTEARQAEKLSKVALDRYRNNCILVTDSTTKQPAYFQLDEKVIDPNPKRHTTLRPGVFICNKLGDTAVVSDAGTIADIARITTPDVPAFNKLMEHRK
jgi:hypothetical protein